MLVTGLRSGAVYRAKLSADGRTVSGEPVEYFKSTNRYRDIALSPDGRRIFLSTDDHGSTQDDAGNRSTNLANPGATRVQLLAREVTLARKAGLLS